MNIFTKLLISIMLLGTTQHVFSQPTHVSRQKVDIPFYDGNAVRSSFLKQQTSSDTIWLPASVNYFWNGIPETRYVYEYHENGLLKKITSYSGYTGEVGVIADYNNTYRDPLADVSDTIFIGDRIHPITGEFMPRYRYYYNNRQADSSYWEEYYQAWDGDKWKPAQKTIYVHYLSDTATVSGWQNHVERFNANGSMKDGWKGYLTFDEQGNVVESMVETYYHPENKYKPAAKNIYFYDDEGKCHTRDYYTISYSGTLKLEKKFTNMKWFEFHGFDNGDWLFFSNPTGLYDHYSPKNKNKVYSFDCWGWGLGPFSLEFIDTIKWETEPFSYCYDHFWGTGCIGQRWYQSFNEYYHITSKGEFMYKWDIAPCPDPEQVTVLYIFEDFENKYDERGRRYEYIGHQKWFLPDSPFDTLGERIATYVIDSFTYVGCPVGIDELPLDKQTLLIVPNPANETVRITAADSIATISLYASDGRLAHSQEGSGKEMTVNLRGLPKGIYVVQVRLKDGRVQTGKMVISD